MSGRHDQLAKLREWEWAPDNAGGQSTKFPCTKMSMEFQHSIAKHQYFQADGASLEHTGRDAIVFTAEIPFYSSIARGVNESWQPLYPNEFRAFLTLARQGDTGNLTHPEVGIVRCKLEKLKIDWDANKRGGCDVAVTWLEDKAPLDADVLAKGRIELDDTVLSLDTQVRDYGLTPTDPTIPPFEAIARLLGNAQALADQSFIAAWRVSQYAGKLGYAVGNIMQSFNRLATTDRLLAHEMRRSLALMESRANEVRAALGRGGAVVLYTTPRPMSIAEIAVDVQGDVRTIANLNPHLVRRHQIPSGATVRYLRG